MASLVLALIPLKHILTCTASHFVLPHTHLQVKTISEELGVGFLGVGFDPKHTIAQCPMMPKGR